MGKVKIRYLVAKKQKGHTLYYWQPTKELIAAGFLPRRLAEQTNDELEAAVEAKALNDELDAWRNGDVKEISLKPGTLNWLIDQYQKDSCFLDLRLATRDGYITALKYIKNWAGDAPYTEITRVAVRAWLDTFRDKRRTMKKVYCMGRILYNFAINLGLTKENPFDKHRVQGNPPRKQIWYPEEEEAFCKAALELNRPSIQMAEVLAGDTGQRETDIVKLAWTQYDGRYITLTQSKTGVEVIIPVTLRLKALLDNSPKVSTQIVVNEVTGRPYKINTLSALFRKVANKGGLPKDRLFKDLRRTAVINLALADCEIPEIASITGHSIDETTKILQTYLPKDIRLADSAILKLENYREKSSNLKKGC